MLVNVSPAASKTSTWPRFRAARVTFLVLVGVCLVYLAYSGDWLHGGPPILHAADISQHCTNNLTVGRNVATRGNSAISGRATPNQSMTTTSAPTLGNARRGTTTTNHSMPDKSQNNQIRSAVGRINTTSSQSRSTTSVTTTTHQTPTDGSMHVIPYKVYAVGMGGRIGNQMFEYAAGYGTARMNNRSAVTHDTNFNMLRSMFTNLSLPRGQPLTNMLIMAEGKYGTYAPKFEKLPESNIKLWGYFQSWKYFQKYERDLRQEFIFEKTTHSIAMEYLVHIARMRKSNSSDRSITFVGVHVRRGDRVHSLLYRVASKSYIIRAMNYFRRNFSGVHFVVCSDDIQWCKQNLGQHKNVSFSEGKLPNVDLAILSLCNHTVSTVGTFSWWAGWLAGGVTTYYTRFANTSTYMYSDVTFVDYFLPNWIPMSD